MSVALTHDEALQLLADVVADIVTAYPLVQAWSDVQRPAGGHLEYREISDSADGDADQCDGEQTTPRLMRLDLRGFGAAAPSLRQVESVLRNRRHILVTALSDEGVSIRTIGPVQDVTAMLGRDHERRTIFSLQLGYLERFASSEATGATGITLDIEALEGIETGPHTIPLTLGSP